MKFKGLSTCPVFACAALVCALSFAGCEHSEPFGTSNRRTIEPAPVGLPQSGIGAPGGASADTRAVGSIAASEGQATATSPAAGSGVGTTSSTHR